MIVLESSVYWPEGYLPTGNVGNPRSIRYRNQGLNSVSFGGFGVGEDDLRSVCRVEAGQESVLKRVAPLKINRCTASAFENVTRSEDVFHTLEERLLINIVELYIDFDLLLHPVARDRFRLRREGCQLSKE